MQLEYAGLCDDVKTVREFTYPDDEVESDVVGNGEDLSVEVHVQKAYIDILAKTCVLESCAIGLC